jgi:hypothetical protein
LRNPSDGKATEDVSCDECPVETGEFDECLPPEP